MPIYEYRCHGCRRRVSLLVRSESTLLACPQCGSQELTRLFSTFAIRRSYMDAYDSILSDNQLVRGLEHSDPRALAEWNRRMSQGMEEDVGPEYQEMVDRLEAGEMPTELTGEPGPVGAEEE